MSRSVSPLSKSIVALSIAAATFAVGARSAQAEITPPTTSLGEKGQLWIDQVSGFRMSANGSLNYYGPIGFSVRSVSADGFDTRIPNSTTTHFTTFWLAPSADFFVIDHLSVGGLIQFSTTSSTIDFTQNGITTSSSAPTTTDFTFLPRAGWMFDISDRFGIWPRLGLGYASRQSNFNDGMNITRDTVSGFIFDLDCGFIFRFTDSAFVKAAPELTFLPGGSHSETLANGSSQSANASAFQFAGVTGIGIIFDL